MHVTYQVACKSGGLFALSALAAHKSAFCWMVEWPTPIQQQADFSMVRAVNIKTKRTTGVLTSTHPVAIAQEFIHDVEKRPVVSVAEYRRILKDSKSSDDQISNRIRYLENLCRDTIRREIQTYVEKNN